MGKGKREAAEKEGSDARGASSRRQGGEDYEFKLPEFDEKAFIRREVASARASFYTIGIGVLAGVLAAVLTTLAPSEMWALGWLPIFASMATLRPLLAKMGFGDEVIAWKALIGSFFMLFFTGLGIWIAGVNLI